MRHTFAWLAWLLTALIILSITRNPLYLLLILLCLLLVSMVLTRGPQGSSPVLHPLRFTLILVSLASLFNTLTSHYGQTVFLTIPGSLPLLSGPLTLEALVYGAINGLVLAGMFVSFSVLNQALPIRALVRLIPRAYYPVALVTSISVTYLPTTLRLSRQIREAQELRGHQVKGLRDWLPLLMPLLVGGMEHAMQLAEAMTARGFAAPPSLTAHNAPPSASILSHNLPPPPSAPPSASHLSPQAILRIAMLAGLLFLSAGWLWRLNGGDGFGLGLISLGALLILGGLSWLGRQSPRTSFRQDAWQAHDSLVVIFSLVLLAVGLRSPLAFDPYPLLTLPPFNPWIGMAILGLLLPVLGIRSIEK